MRPSNAVPDSESLQQCFKVRQIRLGDADEEWDAAAMARPSFGEKEQSFVTLLEAQVGSQHRLSVDDRTTGRTHACDLRFVRARWSKASSRVAKLVQMRFQRATETEALPRGRGFRFPYHSLALESKLSVCDLRPNLTNILVGPPSGPPFQQMLSTGVTGRDGNLAPQISQQPERISTIVLRHNRLPALGCPDFVSRGRTATGVDRRGAGKQHEQRPMRRKPVHESSVRVVLGCETPGSAEEEQRHAG